MTSYTDQPQEKTQPRHPSPDYVRLFPLQLEHPAEQAALFKKTAIREMGHLERLAERVLFLGGDVEMSAGYPVLKIKEPVEILAKAAQMEQESAAFYNNAAAQCGANADATSKQLFEVLVRDEESHFDEFQRQLDHIKRFGPAYLALQSFGAVEAEEALAAK